MKLLAFAFCAAAMMTQPCNGATYYVASNGNDANACSITSPCRTLYQAVYIRAVDGDGVVCLTPPEPGRLSITKSITIDCSSARIQARDDYLLTPGPNNVALYISGGSSATVRLRGFTLDGAHPNGSATKMDRGIQIDSAAAVYLEDCTISNFAKQGIYDARSGGQSRLYMKDCTINGAPVGIVAASQSPAVTVLDNVSLLNNAYGLAAAPGNNVVVTRSTISGNTTAGIHADGGAQINVLNSALSHNSVNINAYGTVRLQENAIQFSNIAIQGSGARSAGANRFLGNVSIGVAPTSASGAAADTFD